MKPFKLYLIILVVFLKTGNVLSNTDIFNVNNIEVEKKGKVNNELLANQAIKKGFKELINKILLKEDIEKIQQLKFSEIKELVTFYQVTNKSKDDIIIEKINYNISFDKDKMHDLFYKKKISYSKIENKEFFILPILKKNNQIFIYNQNYFYEKWNEVYDTDLVEFILPQENIEIIQNINSNKNNLLNLEIKKLFQEYIEKNIALILIEDNGFKEEIIYFKSNISGKEIVKNIKLERLNLNEKEFYDKIIIEIKNEITNLVKSQNLIDITAPLFLNAQLEISQNNSLVELNKRLKKVDLIEKIFIQEFNNSYVKLKIKYLGNLEKIIKQLENQKIILKLIKDNWSIKII